MFGESQKIPQKFPFRGSQFRLSVYIVNLLIRENWYGCFSKSWLPKVFKWVLLLINQLFTSTMTSRSKKLAQLFVYYIAKNEANLLLFRLWQLSVFMETMLIFWPLNVLRDMKSWFINNKTHFNTFGSQDFEKPPDRFPSLVDLLYKQIIEIGHP